MLLAIFSNLNELMISEKYLKALKAMGGQEQWHLGECCQMLTDGGRSKMQTSKVQS